MNTMELHYTIPLDPRTKKNHLRIAGSGARCPACRRYLRQYVLQSRAHDTYKQQALPYLAPRPADPISTPVHVRYLFYKKTHGIVDKSGLSQAADDLLVAAGILDDDNSRILVSHDGTRVLYDKENPRTEIWIRDYNEQEDSYGNREDIHP